MTVPKQPSREHIQETLDLDILECDLEEVDTVLQSTGLKAEDVEAWGASVVHPLLEQRKGSWRVRAQSKLQEALAKASKLSVESLPSDRSGLLSIVESLRDRLGPAAAMAFRKREPALADADELKMLIEELMLLDELGPDPEEQP